MLSKMSVLTTTVGILMAVVTMTAIICNALVVIVICWNKSLLKPLNLFLFNLSVADTGMACTCIPYAVGRLAFESKGLASTFCYVNSFIVSLFLTSTILILTVLCLYQYCMVTGPLEDTVSGMQSCISLGLAWTISLAIAIAPLFKWGKYEISTYVFGCKYQNIGELQHQSYNLVLLVVSYLFPLMLMVFCYFSILWSVRDSDRRFIKGWIISSVNENETGVETGQKRITTTVVLILLSFFLFRTPFFVSILMNTFWSFESNWLGLADQIAFWALYFHAASNPFVYAFQQAEYRSTLSDIARKLKLGLKECCCNCCNKVEEGEVYQPKKAFLDKIDEE